MAVLRRGAKGEDVKRLQALLRSHGSPDLAADGDFGPATEAAVRRFQSEHKLAVDGIVGPQTWATLEAGPATGSPATGSPATGSHEQRIEQAVSFFRKDWSREQAIGIVANLDAESGMDPNIQQHGGGPGYGLGQWGGPRQLEFQRWAGRPIHGSSFEQQLQFVQYELTHMESKAGDALRHARTVEEAAVIVTRQYERPADMEGEAVRRSKRAREIEARVGR